MNWNVIFQVAVLLASVGAGGGIFTAFLGRSKVHAEATAVLTGISSNQIKDLQKDLERMQTQQHRLQKALFAHQAWDLNMMRRLDALGITDMPTPPDIFLGVE